MRKTDVGECSYEFAAHVGYAVIGTILCFQVAPPL